MFSKLALLALIAPLVSALTLHVPAEVRSQQPVTITWDTASTDPAQFTIQLVNEAFNDQFAIANNVDPNTGRITITIPVVPARGGYTLRAVNVGNINDVYSETGTFSVLELSTTFTPSSTASTSSGTGTTSRATTTGTGSTTTSRATTTSASSTTSQSSTTSATTTGTGTSPGATALSGNNADSLKFNAGVAVAALAAGVAAFAL
jgi:hypothetical protein